MTKPRYQYRLVCARHRERGHSTHAYAMPDDEKRRVQKLIDADHHSEMLGASDTGSSRSRGYFLGEAPWRIQRRVIGKWENE